MTKHFTIKEWKALPTETALAWFNSPLVTIRQVGREMQVTFA